jgi:uncharacterized protein (DUF924 family)
MSHFTFQEVLHFWFETLTPEEWFGGGEALDATIKNKFLSLHQTVAKGRCVDWRTTAQGRLAEIIVLDQFSRNIYRGKKEAFAFDEQALSLAKEALEVGVEIVLTEAERQFLYMPFMHSESKEVQQQSLKLFTKLGNEEALKFARLHKEIIDRFGRYPHRNEQLGRTTTEAEREYLIENQHGFFAS